MFDWQQQRLSVDDSVVVGVDLKTKNIYYNRNTEQKPFSLYRHWIRTKNNLESILSTYPLFAVDLLLTTDDNRVKVNLICRLVFDPDYCY